MLVQVLIESYARSLMHPDSETQHNRWIECKGEVLSRLARADITARSELKLCAKCGFCQPHGNSDLCYACLNSSARSKREAAALFHRGVDAAKEAIRSEVNSGTEARLSAAKSDAEFDEIARGFTRVQWRRVG